MTEARVFAYERRTAGFMTVLAALFILVYAAPILWPDAPVVVIGTSRVLNVALWVMFALDLIVRVWLAPNMWRYLATHPLDVATVVLPALRPLRVLRVFTAGQVLFSRGSRLPLLRAVQAVAVAAVVLALISALAVLDAERDAPDATIRTFGDATWWAATTITTVGYGDTYPVTDTGRVVAVALMMVGISLLGIVTAGIASWFLSRTTEVLEDEELAVHDRLARVERRLVEVQALLQHRQAARDLADVASPQSHEPGDGEQRRDR